MFSDIEKRIKAFIKQHNMIQRGDELIIGVSGGADSMMLFHFLYTHQTYYGVGLKIAHIHHGIRPEAEEDALFVEQISREWNIPFYRHDCNIKELAKLKGLSEEEVGRIERYDFFISLSNPHSKIVTAHNMNDQAETLMMRFFRGSDLNGLGGIHPKRDNIIRPLLCVGRTQIEAYCDHYNVPYRQDQTNFMPIYTRNKIRLECIPYIQDNINPNIVRLLGTHSDLYREGEDFLKIYTKTLFNQCVEKINNKIMIDLKQFTSYHTYIQKRIVYVALELYYTMLKDITLKHVESIVYLAHMQSGKEISLPQGLKVSKAYDKLIMEDYKSCELSYQYGLEIGTYDIPEANMQVCLKLIDKETIPQKNEKMYTKYIDYGKIKAGLHLRTRLPGDYIVTKQGTKKLKKLLIDDKIPKPLRENLPLITDGKELVWIVGGRLSFNYYVTETTQQVLEIKIMFNQLQEGSC